MGRRPAATFEDTQDSTKKNFKMLLRILRPAVFRRRRVLNWHDGRAFIPLRVGFAGQGKARGVFSSVSIKYFIMVIINAGRAIFDNLRLVSASNGGAGL
jgi:hypothetical protein